MRLRPKLRRRPRWPKSEHVKARNVWENMQSLPKDDPLHQLLLESLKTRYPNGIPGSRANPKGYKP